MAAYAALVSVMHIIEQIKHHPRPPVSLDEKQVESLTENITFLRDFLEHYSHDSSIKEVESRIADVAYAAEDVIESQIVDRILTRSTNRVVEISSNELYQDLQKVMEDMELVIKEVMKIKEKRGIQDHLQRKSISDPLRSPSMGERSMIGFDDVLNEILEKLTGQRSDRQIIPIVGMGGIGKTTLARNVYVNPLIVQHFDILVWVVISQKYRMQEILVEALLCLKNKESKESLSQMAENELGEKLYKHLSGRRYLVVMDDMWSTEAWDEVKFFFPDNNNLSRIIVTTRLSNIASYLTNSDQIDMRFLDEGNSWNLLCKNVFGEADCPFELEAIGKKVAENCKGLPLSIVVIGGLLRKSERTLGYWEYIAENLNSIVNLEDDEHCLKILLTSYDELPVNLKPCFLYMGVFPEDSEIRVSLLIKLWVADGFLKPISGKDLEEVAEEYLKDLIDRNLILVRKLGFGAKIKSCSIHDLLRDLCLREGRKTKFLYVTGQDSVNIPQRIKNQRRVAIHQTTCKEDNLSQVLALQSSPSITRSLICDSPKVIPSLHLRLLRVLKADDRTLHYNDLHSLEAVFELVNSRYLAFGVDWLRISKYLSLISLFWNLQTLAVYGAWEAVAPLEIWKMPQLKHVKFDLHDLPDPHEIQAKDDLIVLENLQTLSRIRNFKFGEEVIKRIPNIKKLRICYQGFEGGSIYGLDNVGHLQKLESLGCTFNLEKRLSREVILLKISPSHIPLRS